VLAVHKDQRAWQKTGTSKEFASSKATVFSLVYNQKNYIHQACESFLAQKTDRPIKVYLHDDASTDGSQSILKRYKKKFPDIFKIKLRNKNVYNSGNNEIFLREALSVSTPYIALCEGDDFFTDERKLQIQTEFLDKNKEVMGCFHNSIRVDANSIIIDENYCRKEKNCFDQRSVLTMLYGSEATSSCFFRKKAIQRIPDWYCERPSDFFIDLLISEKGSYVYLDYNLSAYRTHKDGIWGYKGQQEIKKEFVTRFKILRKYVYWRTNFGKEIEEQIIKWSK
jgi:glycosyltransferase involved in cell wall biosynthesis